MSKKIKTHLKNLAAPSASAAMLLVQLRTLVDRMETFHAVESISCHIKAFIWEAGVGVQPMKQIFIFMYHFLIMTECKAKFYCFVWCQALQKKVVYHVILMFICWSQCLAEESVYKQDIVYYCHCLTKLILNSIPVVHLFAEMLWLQSKKRVSLALNSYMCPKCRHLPYTGLAIYSRMTVSCNMTIHIACLLDI